ncbi:MAG TPA: YebC/PmpR family DNA-binding transcriptional regulator [Candidatus Paceibacterota bacterium]|nr:YebC/PmpR family DNA-binding transcriptional regulator [Candidatus Paceibacterota bacterium]
MAGHSKWAQIKRQKGVTDAAKSRTFARFARLITLESKKANGDASAPSLAAVVARAKAANMPKDNIERAIARGTAKDASAFEEVLYEAYGPGGIALIIGALTDNRNRTTQEVKHLLSKQGVELAAPGAALWAFMKQSDGSYGAQEPLMEVAGADEEKLGAILESLDEHEDVQRVYTNARGYEDTVD